MRIFLFVLISLLLSACWPSSVSFKDTGSMPEEWKTFSVKTLENNAANCPLSYSPLLTEQIKDGIQNNTRLLLNTQIGKGEVTIEGVISSYNLSPLAIQGNDNASKNRLTISVQFTININAPKEESFNLVSTRFADFDASVNLSSEESKLLEEVNEQIVQDVINKLLSNW
jgi:outer membrane lipopolysaccharide assembly protein LptE/RlpB